MNLDNLVTEEDIENIEQEMEITINATTSSANTSAAVAKMWPTDYV